jgi:NAD+ kinase
LLLTRMKNIGILFHPKVAATRAKAKEIEAFLKKKGLSVWVCSAWEKETACEKAEDADLIITVGGDGTILRAAQIVSPGGIPLLSVNMGKLGFLTELAADEVTEKLPDILRGKGWADERVMLQAEVSNPQKAKQVFHALNDIVVARGQIARIIRLEAEIRGKPLAAYRADGVIAATATGSTGYALAAGGPIIYPGSQDMLLVPVAPHFSLDRSLILPPETVLKLKLDTYLEGTLSIDGHINLPLVNNASVTIKRSKQTVSLLRLRSRDYFYSTLEARLKGK